MFILLLFFQTLPEFCSMQYFQDFTMSFNFVLGFLFNKIMKINLLILLWTIDTAERIDIEITALDPLNTY